MCHQPQPACPPPCLQAKESDLQRMQMMLKLKESRLARMQGGGEPVHGIVCGDGVCFLHRVLTAIRAGRSAHLSCKQ